MGDHGKNTVHSGELCGFLFHYFSTYQTDVDQNSVMSNIAIHLLPFFIQGWAVINQGAGYTLDSSPICCKARMSVCLYEHIENTHSSISTIPLISISSSSSSPEASLLNWRIWNCLFIFEIVPVGLSWAYQACDTPVSIQLTNNMF